MNQNLRQKYKETVVPMLMEQFKYKNIHEVPKITKITINQGLGDASKNNKALESAIREMATITGQRPVVTKARKSVAGFKIRDGMPVGLMVTLRKKMMYSFLERFVNLSLPRIRDFRGVSIKHFDGRGNYTLGVKEHIIFPEIDFDRIDRIKGLDITITTSAKNNQEAMELFKQFNFPFK